MYVHNSLLYADSLCEPLFRSVGQLGLRLTKRNHIQRFFICLSTARTCSPAFEFLKREDTFDVQ